MYNLGFLKKQIDIPEDALFRVHEGKGVELIYGCSLQPNSLNTYYCPKDYSIDMGYYTVCLEKTFFGTGSCKGKQSQNF